MPIKKITDKVYFVGSIDWDRRLFDDLIPLPNGTTYNSYIIKGSEKVFLVDTVDPTKTYELLENLDEIGITNIDYIISQHAEQDHSGSIPLILKKFPDAKVITNEKCMNLLIDHFDINRDSFILIKDDEEFVSGDVTLRFIFTPWVHWPETMLTYYVQENILFTCDMFGSHLATHQLYSDKDDRMMLSAKRYFAEIMLPFRNQIKKHLQRISQYQISSILPSHGPIHRRPEIILEYYNKWSSDNTMPLVIIPYVSMHKSTEEMVRYLIYELSRMNIDTVPLNLAETDIGEFAMYLIDASVVVFGVPTVLSGPHPIVAYASLLMNALRPPTKGVGFIGSFGWGGKTEETLRGLLSNLRFNDFGSVFIKGILKKDGKEMLKSFAKKIATYLKDGN